MARLRTSEFHLAAALLGKKVRALRRSRGLTQERLEEITGIARNQIQNIEHNRSNTRGPDGSGPSNVQMDTVFALAFALKVDPTYLIDPHLGVDDLPLPVMVPRDGTASPPDQP